MIEGYTSLNSFRYERKFATPLSLSSIYPYVKNNAGLFSSIYAPRYINNIYLDTLNLNFYNENIIGTGNRKKIRIRWYGNLTGEIKSPILEYKIKKGLTGTKHSFILNDFTLTEQFSHNDLRNVLYNSELPDWVKVDVKELSPQLLNRYKREYFRSINKKFRITIDSEIEYYNVRSLGANFIPYSKKEDMRIIELKYDEVNDTEAHYISNYFPFRMTKNSKYVNGIQNINHLAC